MVGSADDIAEDRMYYNAYDDYGPPVWSSLYSPPKYPTSNSPSGYGGSYGYKRKNLRRRKRPTSAYPTSYNAPSSYGGGE